VRTILATRADWEVCGEATNGKMAVEMAQEWLPDLIVMDITMPVMSGLEAAKEIAKLNLPSRVLVLSMHELHYKMEDFTKMGIHGYVLKSDAVRDLINALDELSSGGTFLAKKGNPETATGGPNRGTSMLRMSLRWAVS
jgi:DNA-binding NarL/FixJ family response regulator